MSTHRDDHFAEVPPGERAVPGQTAPGPVAPEQRAPEHGAPAHAAHSKQRPTRISGTWVAVIVAIFVLIFLLVFILQNLTDVTIHFLGGAFTWPLGVSLLFAAIGGALLVALVGAARIMQLRRQSKRGR